MPIPPASICSPTVRRRVTLLGTVAVLTPIISIALYCWLANDPNAPRFIPAQAQPNIAPYRFLDCDQYSERPFQGGKMVLITSPSLAPRNFTPTFSISRTEISWGKSKMPLPSHLIQFTQNFCALSFPFHPRLRPGSDSWPLSHVVNCNRRQAEPSKIFGFWI